MESESGIDMRFDGRGSYLKLISVDQKNMFQRLPWFSENPQVLSYFCGCFPVSLHR